jgi:hypothetical protein
MVMIGTDSHKRTPTVVAVDAGNSTWHLKPVDWARRIRDVVGHDDARRAVAVGLYR